MALVDLNQALLLVVFYAGLKIWNRAGGWPEAWYRFRGINYFQDYFITESGKILRPIFKFKDIKHHSPAMIHWKVTGGDYLIGVDNARFANPHNAPAWLHRYDDSRPIPVNKVETNRCDPLLIAGGFKDHVFEELNQSGKQGGILQQDRMMVLILIGIAGLVAIDLYYNWNVNCAVKSLICR